MVVLSAVATVILTSCPFEPVDWSDYEGVNLIASQQFDVEGELRWRITEGLTASTGGDTDFVQFENVTEDPGIPPLPPPLDSDTPVFRLETVNLMRNGDFEASQVFFESQWDDVFATTPDDPANASVQPALVTTDAISGSQSLQLNFLQPASRLTTDLADPATGLLGGFLQDRLFVFHIDFFSRGTSFAMSLHNDTEDPDEAHAISSPWIIVRGERSELEVVSFPGDGAVNPAGENAVSAFIREGDRTLLSFGGPIVDAQRSMNATVDNLRILRGDHGGHFVTVPLPHRHPGRPDLRRGGTYEVRVYVAPDPAAHYHPRFFSAGVRMRTVTGQETTLAKEQMVRDIDGWTELVFRFSGESLGVTSRTADEELVLSVLFEVGASHRGPNFIESGSLLLSSPSLQWTPERFTSQ